MSEEVTAELVDPALPDEVLKAVAEKIRTLHRGATLDLAMNIGQIIVDDIFGGDLEAWRAKGAKDASLRKLAADPDLGVSHATLHRFAAVYELTQRLGVSTWKHLGVSHLRAVLGLPEKEQKRLIDKAEAKGWSVERIEKEARGKRVKAPRGRKPDPGFVKSIRRLDKLVVDRDALFGDLDRLEGLDAEEVEALYKQVTGVKLACEELQARLEGRVSGFTATVDE